MVHRQSSSTSCWVSITCQCLPITLCFSCWVKLASDCLRTPNCLTCDPYRHTVAIINDYRIMSWRLHDATAVGMALEATVTHIHSLKTFNVELNHTALSDLDTTGFSVIKKSKIWLIFYAKFCLLTSTWLECVRSFDVALWCGFGNGNFRESREWAALMLRRGSSLQT